MATIQDIAALIDRFTEGDGIHETPIAGLRLGRAAQPLPPHCGVQEPSFCLIAQGAKRVLLADEVYEYDPSRILVASVDLPVIGQVIRATPEQPFFGLVMRLDPAEVAEAARQAQLAPPAEALTLRGICLGEASAELLEAVARMLRLLERPADIAMLAPLIQREILYRLLRGENGWRLVQMTASHGHSQRVRDAINWLRTNFAEPLHIDAFARQVNMSASSLHHHFKAVTAMSPLQYQKQLRLQEARRLLLAEDVDAATAGHRVGYESASQFSREYNRMFGQPPARDSRRLRETGFSGAAA